MNTTCQDHLAHAISTLKWDLEGWYTTCDIMLNLQQKWIAAGLGEDDRVKLYDAIYHVIHERNVRQRKMNAVKPGTVVGEF